MGSCNQQQAVKNSFDSKLIQQVFYKFKQTNQKFIQLEKLANQSMFNDAFTIEMINISFFHKSKNNFRLIKRKSCNRKNMDGENDEVQWEIYCKNVQSKVVFGKLMYFETEFFVRVVRSQNQGYVPGKSIP